MSNLEDELREAYRAVTETVRQEDLPGLYSGRARRRRQARFSAFAPLAAAAAVVVAIGVGVAVPKLVSSGSAGLRPASGLPAAAPPFMIIANAPNAHRRPLLVVSAATGQTIGEVPVPGKGTTWSDVTPTSSDTTFVLAASPLRGGLCNPTYLYTLTLSGNGRVASLRPWSVPVVSAEIVSLAANLDGGTLAFVEDPCHGPNQEIGIIRGDTTKLWPEPYPLQVDSLSLSPDGSTLIYSDSDFGSHARVRILDTGSAPGSSASAASNIVHTYPAGSRADMVAIGADSATMYVSWLAGRDTFHLAGYKIRAGSVQGTLFSQTMPAGLEISRAGSQLLVWDPDVALYLVDPLTGKTTQIRTAWLNAWGMAW